LTVCIPGGTIARVDLEPDFPYGFDRDHLTVHHTLDIPMTATVDSNGRTTELTDSGLRKIDGCASDPHTHGKDHDHDH
jgi:hypothetical protein